MYWVVHVDLSVSMATVKMAAILQSVMNDLTGADPGFKKRGVQYISCSHVVCLK